MHLPQSITKNLRSLRYGVGIVEAKIQRGDKMESRRADLQAAQQAVSNLFPHCPKDFIQTGMLVRRDRLGKPYVEWHGVMSEWAEAQGILAEHCLISNTSDGDLSLVFAGYNEHLTGVGVDAVWMPRMERQGKNRDYLFRFARQFMSEFEWTGFQEAMQGESESAIRLRVMAHFSLMEAASKACGTGLKIGLGMGRSASLPKQTLGAKTLTPAVQLLIEGEAITRLQELNVTYSEACWGVEADYLIALVLLYKTPVELNNSNPLPFS